MNLNWHVITDGEDPYLKQAFALYDAAFPVELREEHKVLLDSLTIMVIRMPFAS